MADPPVHPAQNRARPGRHRTLSNLQFSIVAMLQSSVEQSPREEAIVEVGAARISYRELCDLSASELSEFNTTIRRHSSRQRIATDVDNRWPANLASSGSGRKPPAHAENGSIYAALGKGFFRSSLRKARLRNNA
jgi:hypothetical protein